MFVNKILNHNKSLNFYGMHQYKIYFTKLLSVYFSYTVCKQVCFKHWPQMWVSVTLDGHSCSFMWRNCIERTWCKILYDWISVSKLKSKSKTIKNLCNIFKWNMPLLKKKVFYQCILPILTYGRGNLQTTINRKIQIL